MDLSLLHPFWAIGLPIAGSIPLGWWMARTLDPPAERVGKGIDAIPLALAQTARPPRAGPDGLEAIRVRRALRSTWRCSCISFVILLAQSHLPILNPDGKGPLTALGYKDMAGHRPSRSRHGRHLQHRLLVRDQHQSPALLRRAASLVFQPAWARSSGFSSSRRPAGWP